MNLGSFMGGAARGISQGIEDKARIDESKLRQEEAERKRKADEREDAYRKEVEALQAPDVAHKAKLAEYEKNRKQTESEASAAGAGARVVGNPVAAHAPSGSASTLNSIIAANGIGAANAMRTEAIKPQQIAQPEAPAAPGFADNMDFLIKRASIDMKHGKLNGLGMIQLMQARKQLEDEGVMDALLQIHSGDTQAGIDTFNQYGKRRVKLIDSKQTEAEVSGVKMPTTVVTIEDENGNRQTINAAQALNGLRKMENQLNSVLNLMKFRQTAEHQAATEQHQKDMLAEMRDYHQGVIDAAKTRAANSGGLTLPQQRTNAEIDAAREYVQGLSQEEIRRRTQQYSATGRENPDYDQLLAAKVRLSQHRKYGEDAGFADIAKPAGDPMQDIGARFTVDPAMKGNRLGKQTQHGIEVFDASGKLIGHWN